jgi:hypothetical protein
MLDQSFLNFLTSRSLDSLTLKSVKIQIVQKEQKQQEVLCVLRKSLLCLPNQFLSNQWWAPSMAQFGKNYFECSDCKIWLQRLKKAFHNTFQYKNILRLCLPTLFIARPPKPWKTRFQKSNYILYIQTLGVSKKQPEFQTAVEATWG